MCKHIISLYTIPIIKPSKSKSSLTSRKARMQTTNTVAASSKIHDFNILDMTKTPNKKEIRVNMYIM